MTLPRRAFGRTVLAGSTGAPDAGSGGSGGDGGNTCTLYPEQTAGPFYLDLDLLRQDISEGKPGGLDTSGETFLRGTQVTDADGIAQCESVYPGLVPGPNDAHSLSRTHLEQDGDHFAALLS